MHSRRCVEVVLVVGILVVAERYSLTVAVAVGSPSVAVDSPSVAAAGIQAAVDSLSAAAVPFVDTHSMLAVAGTHLYSGDILFVR